MANHSGGSIWQVYRDMTASLPHQHDPKITPASRRFIDAFQKDQNAERSRHLQAIAQLQSSKGTLTSQQM
jgi:hypothetical protein